ncbi:isochorismatase family protein [Saccharata proteae CBS 121410]|uniref:Isochorismatase family protein n=1 Tax=Saccharata proteae CBS 121410 TaxID=1314787 RepID=A0A9P4HU68_9PEZI|nr:isochorismatase family protein [Saccharata proteae CBS 121410]
MQTPSHDVGTDRRAVIGSPASFWLHSSADGFDLTHPPHPLAPQDASRVKLRTSTTPISISPSKTALIIIDMQNFFLSEAFGRKRGAGHAAADKLLKYAIPAARKASIQIIWLNWGLTQDDIESMPPAVKRAFGFEAVPYDGATAVDDGDGQTDLFSERSNGMGVDKDGTLHGRIYKGLGSRCGTVVIPNTGEEVDAGRLLMRESWNASLWPPLDEAFEEGSKLPSTPDVWIHKNRMSGLWGATTPLQDFLEMKGIRTLLFAGVNTDQCVSGTLTDAFSKGFDCVLLSDATGTTSPNHAQECIEFNCAKTWGFLTSSQDLANGVAQMYE